MLAGRPLNVFDDLLAGAFTYCVGLSHGPLLSGYDEPRTLSYQITLIGPISADVKHSIEDKEHFLTDIRAAPKTRFNVRIQKQRAFGATGLPIKEVIATAKASGATLNDVVLSICGGALRRYLIRHDELPDRGLIAAVPVSLREVGDTSGANQVASMNCEIGTQVDNPLERLQAVNKNAKRAKKGLAAIREVFPTDYAFFGAPVIVSAMAQLTSRTKLVNYIPTQMNVAISNVPGSRKPMYFAGSKVIANFPVSIATHGCALNITLTSYIDRLDFGLVACKVAVPDVQDIANDILEEFELLKKAVLAAGMKGDKKTKAAQSKSANKAAKAS